MAEGVANLVSKKPNITAQCRTREVPLASSGLFYPADAMNTLEVPLQISATRRVNRLTTMPLSSTGTKETAYVIDAIDRAWTVHDATLTFRRASHHSSCGSCALRIDGVERLPCVTQ